MTEPHPDAAAASPVRLPAQSTREPAPPELRGPTEGDIATPTAEARGDLASTSATTPRRWRWRRWLSPLISIAIVVGVFWFFLPQFTSLSEVWKSLQSMSGIALGLLAVAALWNLATYWFVMVSTMPGLRFREAAVVTEASTAVSNTLPGGGAIGIAMSYQMYYSWGFSRSRASVSLIVSGIFNNFAKLAMPVLALALLALSGSPGGGRIIAGLIGIAALVAAVVVFGLMLHSEQTCARVGIVSQKIASALLRLLKKPPATGWDRATVKFRNRTVLLLRARWPWISLTTLISHFSLYLVLLAALRAVGVEQSQVGWIEVLAVFSFARLVTAIPLTPGGLGVVELALIGGLAGAGGPRAEVAAAVLLFRGLTYVLPIPVGLLCYVFWRRNSSWRRPPNSAPRTPLVPEVHDADVSPAPPAPAPASATGAATVPTDVRSATADQLTIERSSSPGSGRLPPLLLRFRHPWSAVALAVGGAAVLGLATIPVDAASVPAWERGAFRVTNDPTFIPFVLVWPVMQLGNFLVIPLASLVAAALRRFRLAAAILVGGGLVYWLAKVVKHHVERGRPFQLLPDVHIHGAASLGLGFPSGHAAVAVLIATVSWPYLGRRGRVVAVFLAALVCLARLWVGAHLPLDVVAGASLGFAVGTALVAVIGRPDGNRELPRAA